MVCSSSPVVVRVILAYRRALDRIMPKMMKRTEAETNAVKENTKSTAYVRMRKRPESPDPSAAENPARYSYGSIIFVKTTQARQ